MFIFSKMSASVSRLAQDKKGFLPIILLLLAGLTMVIIATVGVMSVGAKRQNAYALQSKAYYCAKAVKNTLLTSTSSLATAFSTCPVGNCIDLTNQNAGCVVCSDVKSVLTCVDSTINPPIAQANCYGRAQITLKTASTTKNLTITADCDKTSYSVTSEYDAASGGTGGGIGAN